MPSGITDSIYRGEGTSTKEFLTICARQFGGLHHMEGQPYDAPLTPPKPRNYYENRAKECEKELEELKNMTHEEYREKMIREGKETLDYYEKRNKERLALKARYEIVKAGVKVWEPPTPDHQNLKDFAIRMLDESIDFDCRPMEVEGINLDPTHEEVVKAYEKELAWSEERLEYAKTEDKEARQRYKDQVQWIEELNKSLNQLPSASAEN